MKENWGKVKTIRSPIGNFCLQNLSFGMKIWWNCNFLSSASNSYWLQKGTKKYTKFYFAYTGLF